RSLISSAGGRGWRAGKCPARPSSASDASLLDEPPRAPPMTSRTARRYLKAAGDATLGWLSAGVVRGLRVINRKHMANFAGPVMRAIGPRLKEHEIGRVNRAAAFPEKSPAEIEAILRGIWDNLGRVAAEFAHIDRLQIFYPDQQSDGDILYTPETYERFQELRRDGKPALIFAAHLANWELPALVATKCELDTTVLYRRLNIS